MPARRIRDTGCLPSPWSALSPNIWKKLGFHELHPLNTQERVKTSGSDDSKKSPSVLPGSISPQEIYRKKGTDHWVDWYPLGADVYEILGELSIAWEAPIRFYLVRGYEGGTRWIPGVPTIQGELAGSKCRVLLDSGCGTYAISRSFAEPGGIEIVPTPPIPLELAEETEGERVIRSQSRGPLRIQLGEMEAHKSFYVLDRGCHDVILSPFFRS
jgi:hypothetical protein